MDILIIIFIMCFLYKIKIKDNNNDYLSIEYTKYLKGILALVVVFCHIQFNRIDFDGFKVFNYIGDFAVSLFFFLSGYGLISQYIKRGSSYLEGYVQNRLLKILKIYILFIFIYTLVYFLNGTFISFKSLLSIIFSRRLIVSHSWYIIDILILYTIFYFAAIKYKNVYKKILISIIIFSLLLVICFIIVGYDQCWYVSILSFSLGFFYKLYLEKHINTKKMVCYTFLFIVLCALQIIVKNLNNSFAYYFFIAIVKNFTCIFFSIIIINLGKIIQFRNPIFKFIGEISLELYLIHGLFENIFKNINIINNNDLLYGTLILIFSIFNSYLINKMVFISKKLIMKGMKIK